MDDMELPQMGDRVREIVTERTGLVTGTCEYLWGCQQLLVYIDGETDKDGSPRSAWWDVGRLEVVERGAIEAIAYARPTVGAFAGPDREAPQR